MGQKYLIKQTKYGLFQMPIEKYMEITLEEVTKIGNSLGIDWGKISQTELVEGAISEAKEHPKVITDTASAVQVALDHLQKIPDYYSKLKEMEGEVVQKGGPGSGRKPEGGRQEQSLDLHANIKGRLKNTLARAKARGLATGYRPKSKNSEKPYDLKYVSEMGNVSVWDKPSFL